MVRNSWNNVSRDCITNCWQKCDIVDKHTEVVPDVIVKQKVLELEVEKMLRRLRNGYYNYVNTVKDYIEADMEEPTGECLSDNDIIELIKKSPENESEDNEELVVVEEEIQKVDSKEAFEGFKKFCLFMELSGLMNNTDVDSIAYFKTRLNDVKALSLQQSTLDN